MNPTIVFAKLQQNYLWKQKKLKQKHRVTKMSEQEWNRPELQPYIKQCK